MEKDNDTIRIYSPINDKVLFTSRCKLKGKVKDIFLSIQNAKGSSFSIDFADDIIKNIGSVNIKTASLTKADIFLVIHDIRTGHKPEVGFSIKSQIGNPSTLLNASSATNFIYQIEGKSIEIDEINSIEGRSKIKDRLKKIYELGGRLNYVSMDNDIFESNLSKIDTVMPQIVSEALKKYYLGEASRLNDIVNLLENQDSHSIIYFKPNTDFYKYKLEKLLEKIALGLIPNTPWDGKHQAGGYIIVRTDGELVCFHIYNLCKFREYLLMNTKFDTPSTSRHKYGSIFKKDDKLFIKLNLQIRFIS